MGEKRFATPVAIRIGIAGQRVIRSAWEALECLRIQWPRKKGPHYRKAIRSCKDTLDGRKPTEKTRHAFLGAAKEAGICVDANL